VSEHEPTTLIDNDRIRLRVLQLDTEETDHRDRRRMTIREHFALGRVLDELHRLNVVTSMQEAELRELRAAKNAALQKGKVRK
jgi:hypothetical protein